MIDQYSFPFEVDEVANKGLTELVGVLYARKDGIYLQYEVRDKTLGIVKSQPKNIVIPYTHIAKVSFEKSFFSCSIIIKAKGLLSAMGLDDIEGSELELDVKRKHAQDAQGTASYINSRISDLLISSLEDM